MPASGLEHPLPTGGGRLEQSAFGHIWAHFPGRSEPQWPRKTLWGQKTAFGTGGIFQEGSSQFTSKSDRCGFAIIHRTKKQARVDESRQVLKGGRLCGFPKSNGRPNPQGGGAFLA